MLPSQSLAIVVRTGNAVFALTADGVADVQEIVVKPLDRTLSHLGVYAGSTKYSFTLQASFGKSTEFGVQGDAWWQAIRCCAKHDRR